MNQEKKIIFIQQVLNELFPDPKPTLLFKDAFTCLIAVLLSAQTTDIKVNQVTPALFFLADTPEKMVVIPISTIQNIIRPIGMSTKKAAAVHRVSELLIQNFQGQVPQTIKELETLPLVGWKTASVVLSQAFHIQAFPVDTHIIRLSKRWELSSKKSAKEIGADLMLLFPESSWNKVHLQMINYGRKYCPAKKHNLSQCPICSGLRSKI